MHRFQCHRVARGSPARWDLYGGCRVTGIPTVITIDYDKLAELVPAAAAKRPADDRATAPPSSSEESVVDGAESAAIDGTDAAPSWITRRSSIDYSIEIPKRAGEGEPGEEARQPALETAAPTAASVNELDAAYEAIPEVERSAWYERAGDALEASAMTP